SQSRLSRCVSSFRGVGWPSRRCRRCRLMCRCRRLVVTLVWLLMDAADLAFRRATLEVVVSQAQEDLGGLWRSLLSDPLERAAAGMREAVPAVAEVYWAAAAENAAIWYEDVWPAVAPRFEARVFRPV